MREQAREHDIYIQSGSMLERDPRWPGVVFNATCLIEPRPRDRGDGLRRRREPGRLPAARSAVLVARRHCRRTIDISALRHQRATRKGHAMLGHLRTEAYPVYRSSRFGRSRNP